MCAVVLCGPRTAAERVPWSKLWDFMEHDGEAAFVHLLWEQPLEWVAEFVDASAGARLGGQARNVNGNLSRVLRAAVVHHGLPCPTGDTFLREWLAGTPVVSRFGRSGMSLADWLAVDPLMPDLLHLFLAAGECGRGRASRRGRRAGADGTMDRAAVVETVLAQLTTAQRPKSQRVLVGDPRRPRGDGRRGARRTRLPARGAGLGGSRRSSRCCCPGRSSWRSARRTGRPWPTSSRAGRRRSRRSSCSRRSSSRARWPRPARTRSLQPSTCSASVDDVAFATKVQATRAALGLEAPAPPRSRAPSACGSSRRPRAATGVQAPVVLGQVEPSPLVGGALQLVVHLPGRPP